MTKEFLKEHNFTYTEYDVSTDAAKRAEMIDRSEQMGVPVTIIDDSVIIGFDKDTISELLEIK
jgi:glutaredoxin